MALKQFWWPWYSVEPTGTLNADKSWILQDFQGQNLFYGGPAPNLWPSQADTRWHQLSDYYLRKLSRSCCGCSRLHRARNRHVGRSANTLICTSMQRSTPTARIMSHGGASLTWRERCTSGPTAVPFEWGVWRDSTSSRGSHTVFEMDAGRVWQMVPRSALPEQIKISLLEQDGISESRNLLATSSWQWHRC